MPTVCLRYVPVDDLEFLSMQLICQLRLPSFYLKQSFYFSSMEQLRMRLP